MPGASSSPWRNASTTVEDATTSPSAVPVCRATVTACVAVSNASNIERPD